VIDPVRFPWNSSTIITPNFFFQRKRKKRFSEKSSVVMDTYALFQGVKWKHMVVDDVGIYRCRVEVPVEGSNLNV